MDNVRSRVIAGLAGATLCLFAVTGYAQTPTTTTGSPDATAQTTAQPTQPATPAPSGPTTDPIAPGTTTDITTTETTTWSFPGGVWGILGAVALVALILFAVFRGRDTTVVKETYVAPNTGPGARNTGMGTGVGERDLSPRAASGTEPRPGGVNDPNTRL